MVRSFGVVRSVENSTVVPHSVLLEAARLSRSLSRCCGFGGARRDFCQVEVVELTDVCRQNLGLGLQWQMADVALDYFERVSQVEFGWGKSLDHMTLS